MIDILIQFFIFRKPKFHLCWMDIDVQHLRIDLEMQYGKWIFMLHHKGLVCILDRFRNNLAFNVPSVYEIVFKVSVSPGDHRFPNESCDLHSIFKGFFHFQKIICNISSVNIIDNIFQPMISGGMKLHLGTGNKFKGYFRMGQRHALHQFADISRFGLRGF